MRTCGACGEEYRTGKIATVIDDDGGASRMRVCPRCAGRAVRIVAKTRPREVREVRPRTEQVDAARRQLRTVAAFARTTAKTMREAGDSEAAYHDGRASGLESALELLE
jgi:DNA-directed RNA polymerase subunit RPC12/RpoP